MRLILQCAVCGTMNNVGLTTCGTCRSTGLENLRLLFECLHCFRVGLTPSCEICAELIPLDPAYEVVPEPLDPDELARRWGVHEDPAPVSPETPTTEPLEPVWVDEPPDADLTLGSDSLSSVKEGTAGAEHFVEDDKPRRESSG